MWAAIDVFSIFLFQLTLWTATGQQILIEIWEDFSKAKLIHLILLMTVSWTNDKMIGSFDKNLSRSCFSSWKLFFFDPVHAGFQNLASPPRVSSGRVTTLQKKKSHLHIKFSEIYKARVSNSLNKNHLFFVLEKCFLKLCKACEHDKHRLP